MPLCSFMTTATTTAETVTTLSATVATLSATVATHTSALSCGASSGRRLETDEPASAKHVIDAFLARRPDIAAKVDAEWLAGFEELGQDFGLPAHA